MYTFNSNDKFKVHLVRKSTIYGIQALFYVIKYHKRTQRKFHIDWHD